MRFRDQTLTDFLLTNEDRHLNNFGILRNPETLKFLSMAPIFDTGNSMFWNSPFAKTRYDVLNMAAGGLEKSQDHMLSLVHDRFAVKIDALPSETEVLDFYAGNGVFEEQAAQIAHCFAMKADLLYEFQKGFRISKGIKIDRLDPPYLNGSPNPVCMENLWKEHMHTPESEQTPLCWGDRQYSLQDFAKMYLTYCRKEGHEPLKEIAEYCET